MGKENLHLLISPSLPRLTRKIKYRWKLEKGNIYDAGLEEEDSSFYGQAMTPCLDPFFVWKNEVIKALEGERETP